MSFKQLPGQLGTYLGIKLSRWPIPALGAWLACWCVYHVLLFAGLPWSMSWTAACVLCLFFARFAGSFWRSVYLGAGFPLSWALLGQIQGYGALQALAWLVPLAILCSLYPLKVWSDAPLFPTPVNALKGLADAAPLGPQAKVLDAGCGVGAGLEALGLEYPQAQFFGCEISQPLAWLCALRHPKACIQTGDMWQLDWSCYDLVYLFQRPESMSRALKKAQAELASGAYLVSLEFAVPNFQEVGHIEAIRGKPVWVYQMINKPNILIKPKTVLHWVD